MRFLIEIFYFSLVLYCVVTESHDVFTFNAISLGHSGLLITWKPNIKTSSEKTSIDYFFFHLYSNIIGEKNNENSTSEDHQSFEPEYIRCKSSEGSCKIHSLNESTLYEVIIKQYTLNYMSHVNTYSVKMRTNWKSKRTPAKPYFEFIPVKLNSPGGIIRWYPCGRERICHDQESGTHFGITIKEPYNTRKLSEVNTEEFYEDNKAVLFPPGRIYEVVVYSVNGECKTDSDSQELFFNPTSSPVQHVKVISLPDLSVLITWKPPKQYLGTSLTEYAVFHVNSSHPNADEGYNIFLNENKLSMPVITFNDTNFLQTRIFSLIPEVMYTFFIIPETDDGLGFEYKMKYKLQVYDQDLPIAKPDFKYELRRYSTKCAFSLIVLPCGQSFDCKNTKPGSEYFIQVKPEPLSENYRNDTGYYEGSFYLDLVYDITVKSSIGSNFSEAVTKKFKNCEEILYNISSVEGSQN